MKVIVLEPEPKSFPSAVAYALARYSRSEDSLEAIQTELLGDPEHAAERLAKIFHGYGHDSVAGMAHLPVALEDITILDSLRFFYACPYGDGQERSTRYQSKFLLWASKDAPEKYRKAYVEVGTTLLSLYYKAIPRCMEVLGKVYAPENEKEAKTLRLRALDCARYLLPLGVRTSLGQVQSARAWRDYLKYLASLPDQQSRTIRRQLQEALEKSGIGLLVRHCDPPKFKPFRLRPTSFTTAKQQLVADQPDSAVALVEQQLALDVVGQHPIWQSREFELYKEISDYLLQFGHRDYCRLANLGAIRLRGYTDLGTLKDLNRHRSLEKFIPLLEPQYNLKVDLERSQPYSLPPYPEVEEICDLKGYYPLVKQFMEGMANEVEPADHLYHCKCLLPQAHRAAYSFYGSPADFLYTIRLRVRPGGHLSYRQEVAQWAQALSKLSPLWQPLADECGEVKETPASFFSRG